MAKDKMPRAEEVAAALRELGFDRQKTADRFGITLKDVYRITQQARLQGLLGKTEYKTVDRSITMVFTSAAGDIFCATQKTGQEGWIKFSFILNGKGNWYESATLFLSEEEVRRVERGITFALACKMLSDARRQMARGKFDAASYMAARIEMLKG